MLLLLLSFKFIEDPLKDPYVTESPQAAKLVALWNATAPRGASGLSSNTFCRPWITQA